jgi:membrane-associated protease RseP (regulator of RpoE activity)
MIFSLGVLVFALGILLSVCLHEAGHLLTAKAFGMKATQYFAGFGPTIWSFKRGETEYGLKAIPAGGYVKIIGMTPLEELAPEDQERAFYRYPLWQRTVVLVAGSATHFLVALVIFFIAAITTGLPSFAAASFDANKAAPVIGQVTPCVVQAYDLTKDGDFRACRASDPSGPAKAAGLLPGDLITSIGGTSVQTYGALVTLIRKSPAGPVAVGYVRDGVQHTATVDLVATQRPPTDNDKGKLSTVSAAGIALQEPNFVLHYGVAAAPAASVWYVGQTVVETFSAIGHFPSGIPNLVHAIGGGQRSADSPVSVVGASRIGGESFQLHAGIVFFALLGGLNVFIGVFNLFPLLPLDGGHVAIAWFERVRSWFASRLGRPDPGRVDYNKLLPLTYLVVLLFVGLTVLTLTADIVNPIKLQP